MTTSEKVRVAAVVISATVAVIGLAGLLVARDVALTASRGALMGWPGFELGLLTLNPLGALLTLAVGVVALLGAVLRRWAVVAGSAVALLAMSLQVIVQWGGDPNWLGSRGSNLSFWLGAALGLGAVTWATQHAEVASARTG